MKLLLPGTKGGLISESFSLWLKSPNHDPEVDNAQCRDFEIWAKVKNFLRLSHLYL